LHHLLIITTGYGSETLSRGSASSATSTSAYSPPATSAPAGRWEPYGGGYNPKNRPASSSPAPVGVTRGDAQADRWATAPAAGQGWKPPTGYGSETISRSASVPVNSAPAASNPWAAAVAPAAGQGWKPPTGYGSETISRTASVQAAGQGWKPPTGYGSETISRPASVPAYSAPATSNAAAPMTNAPEKKWAGGYGGYDPKRR